MIATTDSVSATLAENRVSWGAIIAGAVVALTIHVVLAVLGLAIGASVINPLQEANPVEGIGIGAGIYFVISAILAVLAGGYVAGALSRIQERRNRTLHGLATWALVTLLSVMLLATGLGRLVGGTMNIVGSGLSQAGSVASAVAGSVTDGVARDNSRPGANAGQGSRVDVDSLRQEARDLLRSTGEPALQPGELEDTAGQLRDQATNAATRIARNPGSAEQVIKDVFDRMERTAQPAIDAADRDTLVDTLAARTDMSRSEVEQTVSNWERTYADASASASANWDAMKTEAEQRARELGQDASDAVATAAWWTFFMLLLTAVAAAIGANLGANRAVVALSERATRG